MFANNPMGLVVKNMMDELNEEGEISAPGWQDWVREHGAKIIHALEDRRAKKGSDAAAAALSDLQPVENCG